MRLLITGSSGFIAQHFLKSLPPFEHYISEFDLPDHDITDGEQIREAFDGIGPNIVLHLAAFHPMSKGEADPYTDAQVNIIGTLNLLLACKKWGSSLIFASSGAVYGNDPICPVKEEGEFIPESYYGTSKHCAEKYVLHFAKKRGVRALILRFSSVYGAGRKEGPINQMLEKALRGEPIMIYGDGAITRDFTYVDDVVQGIKLAVDGKLPYGEIYNIASGKETSINDVVGAIESILGRIVAKTYLPERLGDIKRNYFDISKARKYGYEPKVSLEEGIKKLVEEVKVSG